ncbi:hypothetical protein ACOSQ3_021946 [Xanthoceras sorbifolium]
MNEEIITCSSAQKLHFVLVHGAGHGGWCWFKIRSLMETSGYKVTCFDLKSAGTDPTDANSILSFDDYNRPLVNFFLNLPENEKVILVGHSAGGHSLTDSIHRFGFKKIHMAIYVAATMLKHGFATDQDVKDAAPELSEFSEFVYGLGPDQPPTSTMLKTEFNRKILYQMSPVEDSVLASMLLRPAPARAFSCQFAEGPDADRVPRVYIKTSCDRVVKPEEQQDAMIRRWPPSQVFVMESDHSPFFSNPFVLFDFIVKAVASINV